MSKKMEMRRLRRKGNRPARYTAEEIREYCYKTNAMVFNVEGFGQVGYANLMGFAPFPGFKLPGDLNLNETTEGCLTNCSDGKPERITRIK